MSGEPEVLTRVENSVGRITLNRPKALHALTLGMCQAMTAALLDWRRDPMVKLILLDHSGERGFCAGGDIRLLADSGAGDGTAAKAFFHAEYRLNELLFSYDKPTVAVMDGVVMGGGVGIALPCTHRIATERTKFAMPETGIGLFPDVGGGWFLPRLPGQTGMWLALTGARIGAADCVALGLATAYVPSGAVEALKTAILAAPQDAAALIAEADTDPGPAPIAQHRAEIDRLFGADSVEAIMAALRADPSPWAQDQAAVMVGKSPQALKVSHRQLREGAAMASFSDNMAMEYALGGRIVRRPDFLEGVRAVIVDKDNAPHWSPATLDGVSDDLLDSLFAPLPASEAWTPLPKEQAQ